MCEEGVRRRSLSHQGRVEEGGIQQALKPLQAGQRSFHEPQSQVRVSARAVGGLEGPAQPARGLLPFFPGPQALRSLRRLWGLGKHSQQGREKYVGFR